MKEIKTILLCLIGTLLLANCGTKELAPKDYEAYFADESSGMVKEQMFEHMHFKMACVTPTLLAIKRSLGNYTLVNNYLNETANMSYFIFKIQSDKKEDPFKIGINDEKQYGERVNYANTNIQRDFKLEYNNRVFDCRSVLFEPGRGVADGIVFSLVFDDLNLIKAVLSDVKLVYDDKLFGLGTMKFNFKKEQLEALPKLKL